MPSPRFAALGVVLLLPALALANAPTPDRATRALTAQTALAKAKAALAAGTPAAAVSALEAALPSADGDPVFLDTLRNAYSAALAADPDPATAANLRTKLQLLGGSVPIAAPPVAPAGPSGADSLTQATALFKLGAAQPSKLADAAKFFAAAFQKVEMTPDQLAAWAFCRVRVAADRLGHGGDPAEVAAEVADALKLAPAHVALQERGNAVLAAARAARPGLAMPPPSAAVVETAHFRVRHTNAPDLAAAIGQAAERHRAALFVRWGPAPAGAWGVKCDIVLHPTAGELCAATRQPDGATGHAAVTIEAGQVSARRIDLWADDPSAADDALPRELTHVVLADLFPMASPPAWAAVGMAALGTSPQEQSRYQRTLDRVAAAGTRLPAPALFAATAAPADRVTEFHVGSFALVKFLVAWQGERVFVDFLGSAQRYGTGGALKKVYGLADAGRLDATMAGAAQ